MVSLKLGLGSNSLTEPRISYENVTEYFMHPEYNRPAKRHDIALVRLPERVKTTGKTGRPTRTNLSMKFHLAHSSFYRRPNQND